MNGRILFIGLLLVLASFVVFAADGSTCIICELMKDSPQANILPTMDEATHVVSVYLYYENFSNTPPRTPIEKTMLFVYVVPGEGEKELLRIYTDENGRADFDFSEYAENAQEQQITYIFKIVYCPFCHPEDPGYPCGFDECIANAAIEIPPTITEPADVPLAAGVTALPEDEQNRQPFLPTSVSITYSPPPLPADVTPAFCLPLILIFALLGGALYYTGRNPFAAFSLGTPRVGKHIRYTPTGRGVSVSAKYVAQSVKGAASEAKQMKAARAEAKAGGATKKEVAAAGWKAGVKPAGLKDTLTLGAYGLIKGAGGRVVVSPKGGVEKETGGLIGAIKKAPAAAKKAKEAYKTQMMFVKPSARAGLGLEGGAKGMGKGYGKGVAEALIKSGGALIGGTILADVFGKKLSNLMTGFVINKDATAAATSIVAKETAAEEKQKFLNKIDKLVKSEKMTEIKVDGKTMYEITKIESGKPVTMRIEKEALKNGEFIGTQTVAREGYTEERKFTGGYKDGNISSISLSEVTVKKGSGDKMIAATYAILAPLPNVPGEYKLELKEIKKGGKSIAPGASDYAKAADFARGFDGKGISAEILTKNVLATQLEKGVTIGSMGKQLAASQQKMDAAQKELIEVLKLSGVHAYYKTDETFKDATKACTAKLEKASEDFQKKEKITDGALRLLESASLSPGKTDVAGYFDGQASAAVYSDGQMILSSKAEKLKETHVTGANALLELGTTLATASKEDAMKKVEMKLDQIGMTGKDKAEALDAASKIYKDARLLAIEHKGAAEQAANYYNKYTYTMEKTAKEALESLAKPAMAADIAKAAISSGITYGQDGVAKAILESEAAKGLAKTPEQKALTEIVKEGPYKKPEMPELPKPPAFEGLPEPKKGEGLDAWYEKLSSKQRETVDKKTEEYNAAVVAKTQEYEAELEAWRKKTYGEDAKPAVAGTLVVTSAIQNKIELPKEVYKDVSEAIEKGEPKKWEEAATEAVPVVEKEKEKKREKELKSLSGEKLG